MKTVSPLKSHKPGFECILRIPHKPHLHPTHLLEHSRVHHFGDLETEFESVILNI